MAFIFALFFLIARRIPPSRFCFSLVGFEFEALRPVGLERGGGVMD